MRAQKSQAGVMLIEALVGILIFSIGILALIGMQGIAIKNTTDARYRSEASFLATEIAGRMWVDIGNLSKYDKDYGSAYAPRDDWVNKVAVTLPGIDLVAPARKPTIEVGAGNEVTITIEWRQPGESSDRKLVFVNRINGTST
jgi:type IV pilus assembly protein PilV